MNKDIRISFIGDSFVNGTGDIKALGWAGRLCQKAKAKGYDLTYYNLGVRRNTSRDILQRWQEVESRIAESCDNRVVLSCGVNDTLKENGEIRLSEIETAENIQLLIEKMQKQPGLVIGPPPVADYSHNQRIKAYSKQLEQAATAANLPFIELFNALYPDSQYLREVAQNDTAHPTEVGYQKITDIILDSGKWWF